MADHPVPIEALDGKVGVLGITGSGKTYTAIGLVELLLELGRQTIIIDPTGAYHGLRTVFPIPIFGGTNGDAQITENDGPAVARVLVERGWSAIIDVSLLLKESHATARRFMAGFVATLKNTPPAARYLVIDEADEFMPENATGAAAGLMGDLKWIVRRGRLDGWRVMMVTQRPQDIAKSVLTQCETLIVHKLVAPQDRKAFEEWVKGNADAAEARDVLKSMAKLANGEAYVWSPSHSLLAKVKMPRNRSADSSRTPDASEAPVTKANFQPLQVESMMHLFREALAEEGLADPVQAPAKADNAELARLLGEVAALQRKNAEMGAINANLASRVRRTGRFARRCAEILAELASEARAINDIHESAAGEAAEGPALASEALPPPSDRAEARREPAEGQATLSPAPIPGVSVILGEVKPENGEIARLMAETGSLEAPKGRALSVLGVLLGAGATEHGRGVTEKAWAFMAGINRKSSTWRGHKAALRGYFTEKEGKIRLSAAGDALFAGETVYCGYSPGEQTVRAWMHEIKPAGASKILGELLAAYPGTRTRAELAAATNAPISSSTFRGYLAPLNTLELIEKQGQDYRLARDLMEW